MKIRRFYRRYNIMLDSQTAITLEIYAWNNGYRVPALVRLAIKNFLKEGGVWDESKARRFEVIRRNGEAKRVPDRRGGPYSRARRMHSGKVRSERLRSKEHQDVPGPVRAYEALRVWMDHTRPKGH